MEIIWPGKCKIWVWGPRCVSWALKYAQTYQNHIEQLRKSCWSATLHGFHIYPVLFHIMFSFCGSEHPLAAALGQGLGPPKCENAVNIIWYDGNHMIAHFCMLITFWLGAQFPAPKYDFRHIVGCTCFIYFSYFCISLVWGPCPYGTFWNLSTLNICYFSSECNAFSW
jgi:hypothetical protein